MKPAKWLVLGTLALALSFATSAAGQCSAMVSCGTTTHRASDGARVLCVHEGEAVYYMFEVVVSPIQCPIVNGRVTFRTPNGTEYLLDDDLALPPGGNAIYDLRDHPDWTDYIVQCGDPPAHGQLDAQSVQQPGPPPILVPSGCYGDAAVLCRTPCIEVTKTPDTLISKPDDTVIYTICVRNCTEGDPIYCDLTLYNVQVEDPLLGGPLPGFPTELAPGEQVCLDFPYVVKLGDPDPLENCVRATGEDADGVAAEDIACARVDLVHPDFTVEKTCPPVSKVGDEVCYTVTIRNTGDAPLQILSVDDSVCSPFEGCVGVILFPGDECNDRCCFVVPPDAPNPLVNVVTVEAQVVGLPNTLTHQSNRCETDLVHPCIDLTKRVDNPNPTCGDTVTYTICIENCGDWPLENVEVTDPDLGVGPLPGFPPLLFPGEIYCVDFPYVVQDDDPCPLVNTATVTSNALDLGNPLEDSDDAEICPTCGGAFCTFTQGYYGNPGGKKCGGMSTTEIINAALKVGGPVVVGVPGRSITFDSAACIINRLPAGGTPSTLPVGLGNANCASLPGTLVKKNKPEINNVLVGQIVALTLNLRLFDIGCTEDIGDLGAWTLPATFCTVSNDGCPKKWTVPAAFVGMTVQELLDLANDTLGGVPDTVSASAVNNAVTLINEAFDECAEVTSCPAEEICDNACDDDFDGLINEGCI